jgi:hypothetical protein
MLGDRFRQVWAWLGHVSTVAWLWSLGGAFVSPFLVSLFRDLAPWQFICLGVATFFFVLAGIGTWVRPAWETRDGVSPAMSEPAIEAETPYVSLTERILKAKPNVRDKYPDLINIITPPSAMEALADYIEAWNRERRLARPEDGPAGTAYDNKTLILYEDEFEGVVQAVKEDLARRGVALDTEVNDARGIRSMVERIREASDWRSWPSRR